MINRLLEPQGGDNTLVSVDPALPQTTGEGSFARVLPKPASPIPNLDHRTDSAAESPGPSAPPVGKVPSSSASRPPKPPGASRPALRSRDVSSLRIGGRDYSLTGLERAMSRFEGLELEDQRARFLLMAAELFGYADILAQIAYETSGYCSLEIKDLKELKKVKALASRREAEAYRAEEKLA